MPRKTIRTLGPVLLAMAWAHLAEAENLKQVQQLEDITEYALPNGFTLLLAPDNSRPTTTVVGLVFGYRGHLQMPREQTE